MPSGDRLSDDEAALVFRRASELDGDLGPRPGGWDVPALEEVGREVGIAPEAIRRAVAELRAGMLEGAPAPVALAAAGPVVRAERVVAFPPDIARRHFDGWLERELFEPVRDRGAAAVFHQRNDRRARRARERDRDRVLRLRGVRRLAVTVAPGPSERSAIVRVEAELARSRIDRARSAARGPATTALGALGVVVLASDVSLVGGLLAIPPVGAIVGTTAWRRAGRRHREELASVETALDGALDRLELGRSLQ